MASQTQAREHIVVDGGSKDGTADILARSQSVTRWISEPDRSLYDAINKGIQMAVGDVIGVLNSDDIYADDRCLERVAQVFEKDNVDSCYGDVVYVDAKDASVVLRRWRSGPFGASSFHWGWMPPHPTFFVRREIYQRYGSYDVRLGTAADYELMLRFLVKHRVSTAYVPGVLVRMRAGGVSNATFWNRWKAHRMDRRAWKVNGLRPWPGTFLLKPLRKVWQFV